jgi:hypothetical protein
MAYFGSECIVVKSMNVLSTPLLSELVSSRWKPEVSSVSNLVGKPQHLNMLALARIELWKHQKIRLGPCLREPLRVFLLRRSSRKRDPKEHRLREVVAAYSLTRHQELSASGHF